MILPKLNRLRLSPHDRTVRFLSIRVQSMRRSVLAHLLARTPFRPFRMTDSTEETFDVKHPEAAYLARKFVAIAKPPGEVQRHDEGEMVWIDYRHIVYCQPLPKREIPF